MAAKKTSKKTAKKPVPKKAAAKKAAPKKVAPKKPVAKKAARKAPARKAAAPKKPAVKNPVMHWEIQSQRPADLHAFYADILGWPIDANNSFNYGMVASGGAKGINGGIGGSQAPGSRVLVYAEVDAIDPVLERIVERGGTVVMPRTDIGMVIMAIYTDPEGNAMGLIESA